MMRRTYSQALARAESTYLLVGVLCVLLGGLGQLCAQESNDYNLRMGPVDFNFYSGVRSTYNDNINLSEKKRLDDFIISPYANMSANWAMSEYNTLRVGVGISYDKHINHPEADSKAPILSPDSSTGVDFDVLAGDFRFNFYDHISYQQDPIDDGSISNVLNYGRFINRAGVDGTWNLNDVELMLGGYQENYWHTSKQFEYLDHSTQGVKSQANFQIGPETMVGLRSLVAFTDYDGNVQNDNVRWTIGPFIRSKITDNINAGAEAAFEYGSFDTGGTNGDNNDELISYSLKLEADHRVNRFLKHSMQVSRMVDLGTYSNYDELWRIQHEASWSIIRNVLLGTHAFIEFGDDSGGLSTESYYRYGAGATAGYAFSEHFTASLSYTYTEKDSDRANRDYFQNAVTLDLRYDF